MLVGSLSLVRKRTSAAPQNCYTLGSRVTLDNKAVIGMK